MLKRWHALLHFLFSQVSQFPILASYEIRQFSSVDERSVNDLFYRRRLTLQKNRMTKICGMSLSIILLTNRVFILFCIASWLEAVFRDVTQRGAFRDIRKDFYL